MGLFRATIPDPTDTSMACSENELYNIAASLVGLCDVACMTIVPLIKETRDALTRRTACNIVPSLPRALHLPLEGPLVQFEVLDLSSFDLQETQIQLHYR